MEKITHRFSLDVNKNGIQRTIQGIETGEKYAREIRISLRNGKENYEIPSDDSVKAVMYVRKPSDATPVGYDCEVDGDEIVYTLKHDNVNEAGTTLMQLKLIGVLRSGVQTVLVAPRFAIEVWESDTEEDTSEVETEDFTALETALGKAEAFYDGRVRSVIIDDDYEIIVTFNNDEVYTNDALKGFHSEIDDIASETSETSESLTLMVESTSAALSSEIASATSELAHSTSVYMSTASSELASELDSTASYLGSEVAELDNKKLNKENPVVSGELTAPRINTNEINPIDDLHSVILHKHTKYTSSDGEYEYNIAETFESAERVVESIQKSGLATDKKVKEIANEVFFEDSKTELIVHPKSIIIDGTVRGPLSSGPFAKEIVLEYKLGKWDFVQIDKLYISNNDISEDIVLGVEDEHGYFETISYSEYQQQTDITGTYISNIKIENDKSKGFKRLLIRITNDNTEYPKVVASVKTYVEENSAAIAQNTESIEQNTSDIEDLKSRPIASSLILSSSSPLLNSEEKPILGIDVEGKSEQKTSQILECVQGSVTPSVGTKINQSVGSNTTRGVSNVIYLPKDATVIISSGYLIYTMQSSASDGNIESVITWATSFKATTNGWYRFYIRTSVDGGTVTPSAFTLTANDIAPTPTNHIPIVDASGEIEAHTKNLVYEILNGCNIDGNGVVVSGATYNIAFAKVKKGNTYSLRFGDGISTVYGYFASKPIVGSVSYNNTRTVDTSTSVVAPIDGYIALRCVQSFDEVQIEEGTSATSYVPYASNTITLPTLRSIGSVADELIVNEDGGKQTVKIYPYVFDGSESWSTAGDGAKFIENAQAKIGVTFVGDICLCTSLIADTMANTRSGSGKISTQKVDSTRYRIWVSPNVDTSQLVGATIYVVCENPTVTNLTSEQVASILALKTYKGTTIIDSELDVKRVEYAGDVKGYVDTAIVDYADNYSANHSPYVVSDTIDIPIRGGIRVDDIYRVTIIYYTSSTYISTYEYYVVVAEENGNMVSRVHNLRTPNDYPRVTFVNNAIRLKFEETLYGQGIAERLARYRTSGISRMSDVPQTLSLTSEVVANE